jgi:inorganic triphosphatase YgiF
MPVAQLKTMRRRWLMSDSHGCELVELVEDHVSAHTMGAETTAVSWRELEVELAGHGQVDLLERIEAQLLTVGLRRRSTSKSKPGRLFADRLSVDRQ